MTTRDGTQERTLDPPDEMLSDAELRECERAARIGFDEMDDRAQKWLDEQLADTPREIAGVVRSALSQTRKPLGVQWHAAALRERYIAECAEEYWGDLIEQEKYAQEP